MTESVMLDSCYCTNDSIYETQILQLKEGEEVEEEQRDL